MHMERMGEWNINLFIGDNRNSLYLLSHPLGQVTFSQHLTQKDIDAQNMHCP